MTLYFSPAVELKNSSMANSIGHILHLEVPHGCLPGGSCEMDVRVAQTRISFKFFSRQKAIDGGKGNAFVVIPRYEGLIDGVWWSIGKLVE